MLWLERHDVVSFFFFGLNLKGLFCSEKMAPMPKTFYGEKKKGR
jgi:hypothetical protein